MRSIVQRLPRAATLTRLRKVLDRSRGLWIVLVLAICLYVVRVHLMREGALEVSRPAAAVAQRQSFASHVDTTGDLMAEKSLSVTSTLRGDRGKLIYLIEEGSYVGKGDLLAAMDPSPFEDKVEALQTQVREQETAILTLEQNLAWEEEQGELEERAALLDVSAAELELEKVLHGDGPQESVRLKVAMENARAEYQTLCHYAERLRSLASEDWVNEVEVELANRKVLEAGRAVEAAEQQYNSWVNQIQPMNQSRAQAQLERKRLSLEKARRAKQHRMKNARNALTQGKEALAGLQVQLKRASFDLGATKIYAPSGGIVVFKEISLPGARRKPRVGDVLVQNQAFIDLPDLSRVAVRTRVRESDLHRIAVGQPCSVRVDARPHQLYRGEVTQIGVLASRNRRELACEKWFDLQVRLRGTDLELRPGMTARARIDVGQVTDAICVPIQAVFQRDERSVCYLMSEEGEKEREVEVGLTSTLLAEIRQGLEEGEVVCLLPQP